MKIKGRRSAKDVVVYIKEISNKEFSPLKEHAVVDQKGLTFIPHILPILKGTTVDFLNSDSVAHNVFSPDETADEMNLGTWQRGHVKSYTFRKSGIVSLLCNLHPEMSAYIVVLNNPYFAKTQEDGKFFFVNVPAGKYTLMAWHESRKVQSEEIAVSDDDKVYVDFFFR